MRADRLKKWAKKALIQVIPLFLISAFVGVVELEAQSNNTEVEGGVTYRHLTNSLPPWTGSYLRMILKTGDRDTWYFEGLRQREFNDTGTYFSAADSHVINNDWYWFTAVGSSSGGFYFPTEACRVKSSPDHNLSHSRRDGKHNISSSSARKPDAKLIKRLHRERCWSISRVMTFRSA